VKIARGVVNQGGGFWDEQRLSQSERRCYGASADAVPAYRLGGIREGLRALGVALIGPSASSLFRGGHTKHIGARAGRCLFRCHFVSGSRLN
jgi:hypothetical protein